MESIIPILTQALPVLGGAAGTELAKRAVGALWDSLKATIQGRVAAGSAAVSAAPQLIDELRSPATGATQRSAILAQLGSLGLESDPEIVVAVQRLAAELAKLQPVSGVTMNATKMVGAIGTNNGVVHFNLGAED